MWAMNNNCREKNNEFDKSRLGLVTLWAIKEGKEMGSRSACDHSNDVCARCLFMTTGYDFTREMKTCEIQYVAVNVDGVVRREDHQ